MIYRFGAFHYDARQRLLFRGEERVALEPKAIETLHALIERRGQVVEKAELMKLVWPGTTVEDVGLARNISQLRKALEDEDLIETVPRRGYRFVAEVAGEAPVAPPSRRAWIWAGLALLILGGFLYYEFYWPSPYAVRGPGPALAVVPFTCLCPGMDGEAFTKGLNEVLVAELSRAGGVNLISPGTVDRYRRNSISMSMMGRILGLDALLEGTVQKMDQTVRITVRLVDVRSGRLIWAESYDRDAADPAAAQISVAAEIPKSLINKILRSSSR